MLERQGESNAVGAASNRHGEMVVTASSERSGMAGVNFQNESFVHQASAGTKALH
jgi:hypothetical protein